MKCNTGMIIVKERLLRCPVCGNTKNFSKTAFRKALAGTLGIVKCNGPVAK